MIRAPAPLLNEVGLAGAVDLVEQSATLTDVLDGFRRSDPDDPDRRAWRELRRGLIGETADKFKLLL